MENKNFEEKVKLVGKELRNIFETTKIASTLKEMGEISKEFIVIQESGFEEAFELEMNSLGYYDEDFGSPACDYSMQEHVILKKPKELLNAYTDELEETCEILGRDLTEKEKFMFCALFNDSKAKMLIRIEAEINKDYMDNLEKKMQGVQVEGYEYEIWEEIGINFSIDGVSCETSWGAESIYYKDKDGNDVEVKTKEDQVQNSN